MIDSSGALRQVTLIEEFLRKQEEVEDGVISLPDHAALGLKLTAALKGVLHDLDKIMASNDQLTSTLRVVGIERRDYELALLKISGDTVRAVSEAKELAKEALVDAVIERHQPRKAG